MMQDNLKPKKNKEKNEEYFTKNFDPFS